MGYSEQAAGIECERCGARRNLFVVVSCHPRTTYRQVGGQWVWQRVAGPWHYRRRARCIARAQCEARQAKRKQRTKVRGSMLVLAEPKVPDAPLGTCRWCGAILTGANASRRNYCYPEREGRDCRNESYLARTWSARRALQRRGDLVCVDCGSDHWNWEADHEVALEDGGTHTLDNLVRRCTPCHRSKTARENRARANTRRAAQRELA